MKHWDKEIAKEINPQVTIKITKEDVVEILFYAIGGIDYWGKIIPNDWQYEKAHKWLRENAEPDFDDGEICYEEIIAQILFDGKSVTVRSIEDDKESWLSLTNLAKGIQTAFREGYYSSYNWLVPDRDGFGEWHLDTSQITPKISDVIIQLAVWGEVVYN